MIRWGWLLFLRAARALKARTCPPLGAALCLFRRRLAIRHLDPGELRELTDGVRKIDPGRLEREAFSRADCIRLGWSSVPSAAGRTVASGRANRARAIRLRLPWKREAPVPV
jgi:hypothetical protein